ncbi:hypothetical protein ACP4OV_026792 [Aristida adscensionis]
MFGEPAWASLEPFTVLRVLDCDGIEDHHLAGIEKLIHLKYLRLSSRSITEPPETIGELQYLQTLDVQGTRVKELPLTITKRQQLTHLYVYPNVTFPDGMIGQMHSLEELSEYEIRSYEQVMSLQDFSKLTRLRTLEIEWNFYLPDVEGTRQSKDVQTSASSWSKTAASVRCQNGWTR